MKDIVINTCISRTAAERPEIIVRRLEMLCRDGIASHGERVALHAWRILRATTPQREEIAERRLLISSLFHDVGKNGIDERILYKPESLTKDEYASIQTHVERTEQILLACLSDPDTAFAAGSHHERWDGSGYPRGLKEDGIPYLTRIMTIADVLDALLHDRCYKEGFSRAACIAIMREHRGKIFDPDILDAVLENPLLLPSR